MLRFLIKKECFNLSDMDIMDICKDALYKESEDDEFAREFFNFQEFRDNNNLFTNDSNKNDN